MKKYFLATLLLSSCLVFSQNSAFTPTVLFNYNQHGTSCIGDFNNDLKSDIAILTGSSSNAFTQSGLNSFNQINFPTVSTIPRGGLLADYDNDGNKDLIDLSSSIITVLKGNGTGSFTPQNANQSAPPGSILASITKDFNNDGNADIACITNVSNNVTIYLGQGNGNFNVNSFSFGGSSFYPQGICSNDFNNDGVLDIAAVVLQTGGFYHLSIMTGVGNGTFNSPINNSLPNPGVGITTDDFNTDGNADVCITFNGYISVRYGTGTINFSNPTNYNYSNINSVISNDMNNDSKPDLITVTSPSFGIKNIEILLNNSTMGFAQGTTYSLSINGGMLGEIHAADFNNDTKKDLAIVTFSGSAQAVILFSNVNAIYPGDANSDGIANNNDILELGLHMGLTGAARTPTSNAWNSFTCTPWTGTITTGKNMNHSDCNGDGTINLSDTLAIFNNYGFMHSLKESAPTATPQISIVPDQAIVFKNNWGTASIYVGDASTPVNNINGVAFTVSFNKTLIQPDSVYIEYIPSFINSNNLHFRKRIFTNGEIYTATTHTVNNNVSGNGKIAILHYKIKPNLISDSTLYLGIIKASKMDAGGNLSSLTSGSGTLTASASALGLTEFNSDASVIIYPNPNNGIVTISSSQSLLNSELFIYNSLGQEVFQTKITNQQQTLNLNLAKGIYSYKIQQPNKLVKQNKIVIE